MQDSTSHIPYVQVRGDFPLQVDSITSIKDGEDKTTKLAEAKVGVEDRRCVFSKSVAAHGRQAHGGFRLRIRRWCFACISTNPGLACERHRSLG